MTLKGRGTRVDFCSPSMLGGLDPEVKLSLCNNVLANINSSVRAKVSPGHDLAPGKQIDLVNYVIIIIIKRIFETSSPNPNGMNDLGTFTSCIPESRVPSLNHRSGAKVVGSIPPHSLIIEGVTLLRTIVRCGIR